MVDIERLLPKFHMTPGNRSFQLLLPVSGGGCLEKEEVALRAVLNDVRGVGIKLKVETDRLPRESLPSLDLIIVSFDYRAGVYNDADVRRHIRSAAAAFASALQYCETAQITVTEPCDDKEWAWQRGIDPYLTTA